MRRRSHVREAHCRAAHPVPMIEQVVHIIHMRVCALHRLPKSASVRRGAIDKALAHTPMQHGGDHGTIETLIETGHYPPDLRAARCAAPASETFPDRFPELLPTPLLI